MKTKCRYASWIILALVTLASACTTPVATNLGADTGVSDPPAPPMRDNDMFTAVIFPEMGVGLMDASMPTPCDPNPCTADELCVVEGDDHRCDPRTCADRECNAPLLCEDLEDGTSRCIDPRCADDLDCLEGEYCDTVCVPDECIAGFQRCDGADVLRCRDNGSGEDVLVTCGAEASGFESVCDDTAPGQPTCTCRDEWHCPAYMRCEARFCRGAPVAPSCQLPPASFAESLPTPEIVWGGERGAINARGSAFPRSAQVVVTPAVANLDDDNGDGVIDARDFPEIIFLSFCGSSYQANATLRAIHGGGPLKGQDFFASHGNQVWRRGDDVAGFTACNRGMADPTGGLAVGDLDDPATSDGRPEIVLPGQSRGIVIYDNTGGLLTNAEVGRRENGNPAPSLANLDGAGMAEVVMGNEVFTLARDAAGTLSVVDVFEGDGPTGNNRQGPIGCVADILGDARLEIIAGGAAYGLPRPPAGATRIADCAVHPPMTDEERDFCRGRLTVHWDAGRLNDELPGTTDGFCAVADILGADTLAAPGPVNPLDGVAEVIVISNGKLVILEAATGTLLRQMDLELGNNGGAPNVDDFDGDGFPEVGSAFGRGYAMVDLQETGPNCGPWPAQIVDDRERPEDNPPRTPGGNCSADVDCAGDDAVCNTVTEQCVCLHNGWIRQTEDDSSRVTGSTLFDFNGDGAAEVVYNDECWFRIYDGQTSEVLFREPSESRTRIENPIVADVDNDGNAEIVFGVSNESGFCSENLNNQYNNGLEVWGDPNDRWVSARRIWGQHAHHVTQVYEDGSIPLSQPRQGSTVNGRTFNTFRSQPRSFGRAPDLVVPAVDVNAPGDACGALGSAVRITATVRNIGDLRVGPGVKIGAFGRWADDFVPLMDADGAPLRVSLAVSLEPQDFVRVTFDYDAEADATNPPDLPQHIQVMADVVDGDQGFGAERECIEDNNSAETVVAAPEGAADLDIIAVDGRGRICPQGTFSATVRNAGVRAAEGVVVRFYAGDPEQGGRRLADVRLDEALSPGEERMVEGTTDTLSAQPIRFYAVVDPDNVITECDEANNTGFAPMEARCQVP